MLPSVSDLVLQIIKNIHRLHGRKIRKIQFLDLLYNVVVLYCIKQRHLRHIYLIVYDLLLLFGEVRSFTAAVISASLNSSTSSFAREITDSGTPASFATWMP